jgi:hypothetical protein
MPLSFQNLRTTGVSERTLYLVYSEESILCILKSTPYPVHKMLF